MTEERIVALMRSDDDEGLKLAVDMYSRLVRSIASGMLEQHEDVEEVAADTFCKLWLNRAKIDLGRGSLKNYICMIARSCTINKLRTLRLSEPLPDDERDLGIEADFSDVSSAEHNRRVIAECIRSLPSPDREIFIERFYYSSPVKAIAKKLGMKEKRVEYILHKSKRRLREALKKGGILL